MTHHAAVGSPRSATLHGLRGALAFALFLFHVANSGLDRPQDFFSDVIDHALRSLEFGVELFFCISGVVILQSFRSSPSLFDFAWNRVTRIYPVLWVTVSVIAVLSVFKGLPTPSGEVWLANLFALPPLLPVHLIHPAAWSISYEFAFYALFVVHALLQRWWPPMMARIILVALAAALILTHLRAACFLVGLALVWRAPARATPRIRAAMSHPGLWLALALLAWHEAFERWDLPWSVTHLPDMPVWGASLALAYWALGIGFAYLGMGGILLETGAVSRWLKTPVLQWLGTISFSLYLWQTIVMAMVKHAMVRWGLTDVVGSGAQLCFLALSLAPTLLVSHLSQRWLEDALTKKMRRVVRPRGEAAARHPQGGQP
jgi:peptidoglycan/LPS O-acetylase OafA/YrhL